MYLVKNWSQSDKQKIAEIKPIPAEIIKRVGVFVNVNTLCVLAERKNILIRELYTKLLKVGIHVPVAQTQVRVSNEPSF